MMDDATPDWASPPWETISDILTRRGIGDDEFTELMGENESFVDALRRGDRCIDWALAEALAEHLGASTSFWLKRDSDFRLSRASRTSMDFSEADDWLRELPIADMVKSGWVRKQTSRKDRLDEVLGFFGLSTFADWTTRYQGAMNSVAFRKSASFDENTLSTLAWLRQGERIAEKETCRSWDRMSFEESLKDIRPLMRCSAPQRFLPKLKEICAASGVIVVVAKAPTGCRASGAARRLGNHAIIQLSFRHRSDDHFWFTFFHEAGHLILHGENHLFLENGSGIMEAEEAEANLFSARQLIPDEFLDHLSTLGAEKRAIIRFAFEVGTSPGVVVGQMQHRGLLARNRMNFLKRRYDWAELSMANQCML